MQGLVGAWPWGWGWSGLGGPCHGDRDASSAMGHKIAGDMDDLRKKGRETCGCRLCFSHYVRPVIKLHERGGSRI